MVGKKTIIVGGGMAGRELIDRLKHSIAHRADLVGIVDDNPAKQGKKIKGIPVIGKIKQLKALIKKHNIENVFIAIPSAKGSLIRTIINSCQKAKVSFRIVPRTLEIIQGRVNLESIRTINIEDILGRAILKSDQPILKESLKNMRILVTGAAGSIGSELCRQIVHFSPQLLTMLDWWENGLFYLEHELNNLKKKIDKKVIIGNIQDRKKVEWVLKTFQPQIIFHAAAFKHVPLMEDHPEEAIKNNVNGTKICAELAGEFHVQKFIMISTDKAVNPSSVMGASKSYAELLIRYFNKKFSTKYISVRFGNVMGSNGSVVPLFQKQIAGGGPVTITHPHMRRFFMSIPEAVQLILHATKMGKGGEIFMLDMGEPIKIMDLAKTMIRLAGFDPETEIPIKIVGKRPGEKIYEEILMKDETKKKTEHKLIFVTNNVLKIKDKTLMESCEKLLQMAQSHDRKGIIKELSRILPTYKHV